MATITQTTPLTGVGGSFAGANYSGSFIPTLWSSKLNRKLYLSTVFGEITNTDFSGEISGLGDKVVINNIPDVTISDYTIGSGLTYAVPTPSTLELQIDRAKAFAFQVSDVIAHQSKPNMMETFTNDATMKMKIALDKAILYGDSVTKLGVASDFTATNVAAANIGATAGALTGGYNLGTATAPVALTGANVLQTITAMSGVLDEQNVPETDRWLVIDSLTRNILMQSNLAQAQFMGDSTSMLRNGKIGVIDRFTVYVSNQLPKAAAAQDYWGGAAGGTAKRRVLAAGHKGAVTFAQNITKMEMVRNPTDFGDYVRGLNVFGWKTLLPTALTLAVVS